MSAPALSVSPPRLRAGTARIAICLCVLALFLAVAVVGPTLIPYDPVRVSTGDRLLPPGAELRSGAVAWLGTDQLGRDVLAQVVAGTRISMTVGLAALVLAGGFGTALGILSGYVGGRLDGLLMRVADVQLAFPSILLAIFIAAFLPPSLTNVVLVLAITRWVAFARVARAVTLATKEKEFVQAAHLLGASPLRIVRRCLLPAIVAPLLIVATAELGLIIIAEASLGFLGLGTPPNVPSWGRTIAGGRDYLARAWWIATLPGLVLALLVVTVGLLGDALRDYRDPFVQRRA